MSATGRTPLPGVQRYRVAAPVPGSPPTVSTKVWPRPPTSTAGARNCCGTLPSWVTDPACLPLVMTWLNDPSLSAYTTRPAGPTATPRGPSSPSTTGTRLLAPTAADAPPAINTPAVTAAATSRAVPLRFSTIVPPFGGAGFLPLRGAHASTFDYRRLSGFRTMAHLQPYAAWPEHPVWALVGVPLLTGRPGSPRTGRRWAGCPCRTWR